MHRRGAPRRRRTRLTAVPTGASRGHSMHGPAPDGNKVGDDWLTGLAVGGEVAEDGAAAAVGAVGGGQAQLGEDRGRVFADGTLAEEEPGRDRRVGQALR